MEKFYSGYESPAVNTVEMESLNVLCLSGVGTENFEDGKWEWDD